MRRDVASITVAALLGMSAAGSQAQTSNATARECRDLSVVLKVPPIALVGAQPRFGVSVSNTTDRPVRVVNIYQGRRPDLQAAYYEVVILRDGAEVPLPRTISDPGPIGPEDTIALAPGQGLLVSDLRVARDVTRLAAGEYDVAVLVWSDQMAPADTRCRSSFARMRLVVPPQSDLGGRLRGL